MAQLITEPKSLKDGGIYLEFELSSHQIFQVVKFGNANQAN